MFKIAVDDAQHLGLPTQVSQQIVNEEADIARRAYITARYACACIKEHFENES